MRGLLTVALLAALATPQAPTFEAASVKANTSSIHSGHDNLGPGGRYTAKNLSLASLVRFAYERSPRSRGLEPFEVHGGPSWIRSDRFDVNATAGRPASIDDLRGMIRELLAERFHLQTHYETRQGNVYRMVLAQRGKPGPQLRRAAAECAGEVLDPLRGITPGHSEGCGYFGPSADAPVGSDRAYQAIRGLTMADFAVRIYPYLGRRVLDATGLEGFFDGDFEFTAEIVMPPPPTGFPNPYDGRTLPSIFAVLPQQLGLRLEPARGPVEILIIDGAERPAEN
jgi:uncharacterized protein (TIGR03435 family)